MLKSILGLRTNPNLRVLDFDIENRPLSYWGENGTSDITAIATCWADDPSSIEVWLLGDMTTVEILDAFLARYNEAGIVTGHNIRGHDLPIINGALLEFNKPSLQPKLTQDTYHDLKKRKGIPASQEYLLSLFDIGEKVHMTQHDWRTANRLTYRGLQKTWSRVAGDVHDHMNLRVELLKRNLLRPTKLWRP